MDLDAYIRVSRVGKRSGESFISPQIQRERCEGVALAGGHRIIAWHEDLDESGGKADRPGFQKALERIESGQTAGIVVARLDRFARSVADAATAMKRIESADGALLVAESSLDTSTSFGRFAMHMMLAMAELELERIRDSWNAARASAVSRGIHVASRTPTGYDRDAEKRLTPNADAPAVTELFRRKAKGASWSELAAVLESAEVLTPYGAQFWTSQSLAGVLSNRVYLGEARSGEFVAIGAHEPLVDEATWQLAQRSKQRQSSSKGGGLLSGVLRCAGCRYVMKGDRTRARDGSLLRMYRCRGAKSAGKCPAPTSVLARVIEPWVVDRFLERAEAAEVEAVTLTTDVEDAEERRDTARAQLDAYLAADIEGMVGIERYRAELERRAAVLQAAEDELAKALERAGGGASIRNISERWPTYDLPERRQLLSLGIDAIFLRRAPRQGLSDLDNRVLIAWRGEGPDDLPGRGRRIETIRSVDW